MAVATATPLTGAMDTKTMTKNQGGATPRTRSKECARAATPATDCQLGSERSVWTLRKSLIPIAPVTLARTSVQEQNRQAERLVNNMNLQGVCVQVTNRDAEIVYPGSFDHGGSCDICTSRPNRGVASGCSAASGQVGSTSR